MIVHRIALRNFRRFDREVSVSLSPHINLIYGPNESGKTSLVLAVPFALFTSHRSGVAVREVQPFGQPLDPWIQLEIETGGERYRLTKGFGRHRESRVEHRDPHENHWHIVAEDSEADQWMASLFDAQSSLQRRGFPDQWGLAAALWLVQSPKVPRVPVLLSDRLRAHPQLASLEATSDLNRLIRRISQELDPLVTPAQRQPRKGGKLHRILEDLRNLETQYREAAQLVERIQYLQNSLNELEQEKANLESRLEEITKKLQAKQKDLEQLQNLKHKLQVKTVELERAEGVWKQLRDRYTEAQDLWQDLQALKRKIRQLQDRQVAKEAEEEPLKATLERLKPKLQELRDQREQWQRERETLEKSLEIHRDREHLDRWKEKKKRRELLEAQLREAEEILKRGTPEKLRKIRRDLEAAQRREQELLGRRKGIALRVRVEALQALPHLQANEQTLSLGAGESTTFEVPPELTLEIPETLRVQVTPAGEQLRELEQELREVQERQQDLLHQAGVDTVEKLHRRIEEAQYALQEKQRLEEELATLPSLQELEQRIQHLEARLREAPQDLPPQAELEVQLRKVQENLRQTEEDLKHLQEEMDRITAQLERVQEEHRALVQQQTQLDTRYKERWRRLEQLLLPEMPEQSLLQWDQVEPALERLAQRVEAARQQTTSLQETVKSLEQQIQALDPYQEMEQLEEKRAYLENRLEQTRENLHKTQGELEALRNQDPLRREAQLKALLEQKWEALRAQRRRTEALLLLAQEAETLRKERVRALETFLVDRVGHLLRQITQREHRVRIHGGKWMVDGGLGQPYSLEEYLSSGTLEQFALALRLAYGLALAETGDRQMVVLDDALVFSDDERFERILGLLENLADRLQFLILTSRPERYTDLQAHRINLQEL